MPILWCDCANQRDWNKCWDCSKYDDCETLAHDEALHNFICGLIPVMIVIDIMLAYALYKIMGS